MAEKLESSADPAETTVTLYGGVKPYVTSADCEGSRLPPPRDTSPFALKALAYLSYRGVEHEYQNFYQHRVKGNPRKQMPWIVYHGELIVDSSQIIRHLEERLVDNASDRLDGDLDTATKNRLNAIFYLFEQVIFKYFPKIRFAKENEKKTTEALGIKKNLNWLARCIVAGKFKRNVKKMMHLSGVGRLSEEECKKQVNDIFDILEESLSLRPEGKIFISGTDKPSMTDFTLYGALSNMIFDAYYLRQKAESSDDTSSTLSPGNLWTTELLPRTAIIDYVVALEKAFYSNEVEV